MENDIDPVRLMTIQEAADMLRLCRRTVLSLIERKEMPAFKVGHQWRLCESELTKWLEGLKKQ
jgi:excisionase family DNA binding protein